MFCFLSATRRLRRQTPAVAHGFRQCSLWLASLALLAACDARYPSSNAGPLIDVPGVGGGPITDQRQCRQFDPQRQPHFGDLHVHTRLSLDANTQGTIISPAEAYQFAQGKRFGIQPYTVDGTPLRFTLLARPLDFAAVTDHAELLGETEIRANPDQSGYFSAECLLYRASPAQAFLVFNLVGPGGIGLSAVPAGEFVPRLPFCGINGAACRQDAVA